MKILKNPFQGKMKIQKVNGDLLIENTDEGRLLWSSRILRGAALYDLAVDGEEFSLYGERLGVREWAPEMELAPRQRR